MSEPESGRERETDPSIAPPETDASGAFPLSQVEIPAPAQAEPAETRFLKWMIFGPQGVRAGWSAALFLVLTFLFMAILGASLSLLLKMPHEHQTSLIAASTIFGDGISVVGLAAAIAVMRLIERRRAGSYYLAGGRGAIDFLSGTAGGFLALSALVFALYSGGFLRFGLPITGAGQIAGFGLLWGLAFLLVGLSEEGTFRTYLLYTLARGMNFWWSVGCVGAMCFFTALNSKGNGSAGVYTMAALGLLPCLWLQIARSPHSGFWQAAWFTSTLFGYVHTFNPGESWIGIFAAAAIGLVFCVSIRLTGAAWWAIGFHAAWDWTQTFFYGTPDSGLAPQGHYLATAPAGAALWSGGKDGPEGSLLVLPIILLVLLVVVLLYRRRPLPESLSPPSSLNYPNQLS